MKSGQTEIKKKNDGWIEDFLMFCKRNVLWIVFCYVLTFAVYGMCFFHNVVTFDAEGLYTRADALIWYRQWVELGRWALFGMKKILGLFIINPFLSVTICLLLFPFSVLLWGFTLGRWASAGNGNRSEVSIGHYLQTERLFLFVFGAFYLIQPVWALQFGYRNQMEVISIAMVVMPLAMNSLDDFMQRGGIVPFIVTILLVTFCFGCYQSFMFVYAAAACIWLFLYLSSYQKKLKFFWKKVGWIVVITAISFGLNSVISEIAKRYYHIKANGQYLTNQFVWGKRTASENVGVILNYMKGSFFGDKTTGTAWFTAGLLVCAIWCIVRIVRREKGSVLQLLLLVLLSLVPFTLEIVTAASVVKRSQFAYVLVLAFICAFAFSAVKNSILKNAMNWKWSGYFFAAVGLILFALLVPAMNRTTRLMYTQVRTLDTDYSEFQAIYYQALQKGAHEGDAICFVGGKGNWTDESMMEYEQMGFSYMETISLTSEGDNSAKAAAAMAAMGLNVTKPNKDQQAAAEQMAKSMDCWPSGANCIQIGDRFFVVKLAD